MPTPVSTHRCVARSRRWIRCRPAAVTKSVAHHCPSAYQSSGLPPGGMRNTGWDAAAPRPHQPLEMLCLSVDIPCDRLAPARARRAVESLAADVPPDVLADAKLLVS